MPATDILTRLREAGDALLQPGASHELSTAVIDGREYRVYANAAATLREALDAGRAHGERDFIVYEGEHWSFDHFFAEADAIGSQLVARYGIGKGDRVAIAMRNYPEWMAAYTAIVSIGAIVVPLNSWGQARELEHGLSDSGARVLFCDQQRLDYVQDRLGAIGVSAVLVRPAETVTGDVQEWSALVEQARGQRMPAADIDPDDLVMIMYTSGTTGAPKGAASTNRAICQALANFEFHGYASAMANPETIGKMMSAGFEPSTLLVVPLFHVSGCFAVFMLNLRGGRKTAIMYKWDADAALRLIEGERITTFTGVPAMSLALLESPRFEHTDTSSLFALGLGGAATPPHLAKLIYEKLPDSYPGTGYGMTETNASGASCTGEAFRAFPGTAGTVSPIIDIKTVDEAGRDLPAGSTGEVLVRSPTNAREYWQRADASAETFRNGWVATGDIGYVDDNNLLYIVDRIKDMVIRGGENIYPVEVESCVLEHPAVAEVAVYGIPHASWGEELAATVYSPGGIAVDELQDWIGERLAAYKVPSHITIQERALPKNATGKILKRELRQACLDSR